VHGTVEEAFERGLGALGQAVQVLAALADQD
jgi:hypothetical protein